MKKSKTTKRALLVSALSMLLCLAMLIGSTFAWFTDSVTSGMNKIVAGNLDVELYAKDGDSYTPVTAERNLFLKDALWEPGHVEVVNLKVANVGSLALKYQLGINVAGEKTSVSVLKDAEGNNKPLKLSDHIKFALIAGDQTYTKDSAGRAKAIEDAEKAGPMKLSELTVDENDVLYPTGKAPEGEFSEKSVTMIVYMPTTVGNEANHLTGETTPEIDLGVTLVATQTSFEKDSFGIDYDETAPNTPVATAEQMVAAIASAKDGDTIALTNDMALESAIEAGGKELTIDLNNKTLSVDTDYTARLSAGEKLTLKNGKIDSAEGLFVDPGAEVTLDHVEMTVSNWAVSGENCTVSIKGSKIASENYGIMCFGSNNTVTIENSTIESKIFGVYQNGSNAPGTYTIKNTTIDSAITAESASVGVYISNTAAAPRHNVTIENCTISGSTAVEVKHTDLTLTGCTLTATATEKTAKTNSSGSCTTGYKLAITSNSAAEKASGTVITDLERADCFVFDLKEGSSVTCNEVPVTDGFDTY